MSAVASTYSSAQAAAAPPTAPPPTEDEAASYTSSIVQLPPTVPELIQCLEQQHERCAQLTRCLERVHTQTSRLVSSRAGTPAGDQYNALFSAAADGVAKSSSPLAGCSPTTSTPPPPPSFALQVRPAADASSAPAAVVARGVPATTATGASPPAAHAVAGRVVHGTAVTGKVVGVAGAASTTTAVRAVVVAAEPSTMTPSCAPATAPFSEEVAELRVRAVALDAAQGLLTSTQSELSTTQTALAMERKRLEAALVELAELRKALLADVSTTSLSLPQAGTTPASPAHQLADMQTRLAERETEVRAARLRHESAAYALAQLREAMSTMMREKAFLQEKNAHLEGQLQRLLTSSMEAAAHPAPRAAAAAPRLTASEAYQKEALEKQISDLHAMADRLTRDAKKQAARRAKAEEVAQALQKENAELKASALLYRRQVNESELELERAISRKEEDERLRQLERDANRLRIALRDRTAQYQQEKAKWERQMLALSRQARVNEAAAKQLLKRVLACQVREVVWKQCLHSATQRGDRDKSTTTAAANESSKVAPEPATPTVAAASSSTSSRMEDAAVTTLRVALPSPSVPYSPVFGAAADTAVLVDRERQLEELKHTFEQRIALVEAQRKAEMQQLLALNKELRQALTVSQDGLSEKTRLLEEVQRRLPPSAVAPLSNAPAAPTTTSQRPSFSGSWRDTSAAWVCRSDGENGPVASSLADLDSGDPLPSTHLLVVASPRQVTDIERRYNPEHMSTWEAVQVENEALLDRLTTMQEEKWKLTTMIEDLQLRCAALTGELKRNASTMNQLLAAGVLTPAAVSRGGDEGRLRSLQCLLQETLQAKLELEERLQEATRQLR
ncbi:hypothetical protein conserved [Leishmania donovani]|uniref:Uncharacterized protein n=3 Tax=Leishmania donovani species complex TaxID=38574 RepID=A4I181_LEIIN|nr:conserved hypothetical protein [Leishmania infantum JPCM5]TPP48992.1 hypothetical protein CGC20_27055 [Leishmania donovani]CAC9493465.1 hypothetical_protein_-_conserved [Leishmania infantum]CAJ1989361.1 hypothetical protein conserved [Leishmania donovani]CAM68507.1 conserved hypothetical protein [Leishmania infantum JPCM5]SUZ42361.1 hypothetical_protein_-_conserved [Leishmania infantum]|eukprot:XP_001466072.1 conserved hypothetical protein [Leishmania infantum JPCM5]